jgi:hypothetical protein
MIDSELEAAVLKLDAHKRAELAQKLLRSLEDEREEMSEQEISHLWAEEALRRDEELDAGTASARDADDVFRDLRARFS